MCKLRTIKIYVYIGTDSMFYTNKGHYIGVYYGVTKLIYYNLSKTKPLTYNPIQNSSRYRNSNKLIHPIAAHDSLFFIKIYIEKINFKKT